MSAYMDVEFKVSKFLKDTHSSGPVRELGTSPFLSSCDLIEFSHSELISILALFIKVLDRQVNDDHYRLWAWCGTSFWSLHHKSPLAHSNGYWLWEFLAFLNLILANVRDPVSCMMRALPFQEVNRHAAAVASRGWPETIASPLAFALIEGALRRLSPKTLDLDGKVVGPLPLSLKKGRTQINQIKDAFEIYEAERSTRNVSFQAIIELRAALALILPKFDEAFSGDEIECISKWRNTTMHGEEFWRTRVPILTSLVCFLVLDSLDEAWYDENRGKLKQDRDGFQWQGRAEAAELLNLFPPDI